MKLLNLPPPLFFSSFSTLPRSSSFSLSIPSHPPFNPLPSSHSTSLRRLRCRAATPDPPPPHSSDQPPGNDSTQLQMEGVKRNHMHLCCVGGYQKATLSIARHSGTT
ncbi:uncharacterized protein LOC127105489 isoform X2 [Lathyrus oleraceus]|uniref:uncharacterized protein LOC127105489 isoform X2 n=1 Tax=Pisum sativum TaxID=3888 RepID=UPI0021CF72D4|nr:uncharacterized protein LOC127105489 isoform X2 [Pisum sativum]